MSALHPGFAADQLQRIRVFLLRHQAGSGGEGVRKGDVAEFHGGIKDHGFGTAAQVHTEHRRPVEEVAGKVPVGDRVQTVRRGNGEPQRFSQVKAVHRICSPGQRTASQRQGIRMLGDFGEALTVAVQRPEMAHPPVREQDRLRLLEMGVTGDINIDVLAGPVEERFLKGTELRVQFGNDVQHPHAEIRDHLVIAAAPGMQLAAGGSDDLGQAAFHRGVDVLVRVLINEGAFADLLQHTVQPGVDHRPFLFRQDVTGADRLCPGL